MTTDEKADKNRFLIRLTKTPVRISYPKLFRAEAFRGSGRGASQDSGAKKFSCTFMIPKDGQAFDDYNDMILDTIDDALIETFGKNIPKIKAEKWCYRDGDEEEKEEYQNHWILVSTTQFRPTVMDADGRTPLVEEDGKPYGGCFCYGWARIWIQDNDFGKRVNCSLEAVQFVKDGEAFGGRTQIDEEEFKDVRDKSERGRSRDRDEDDRGPARSGDRRESDSDTRGDRRSERSSGSRNRDDNRDSDRRRERDEDETTERGSRRLRV